MTAYLTCNITPGQFIGEWAVRGSAYDSTEFSLFVEDHDVDFDDTRPERTGLLRVEVLDQDADRALVKLPVATFEQGRTITVDRTQIQVAHPALTHER
ncbi:hypothetical protein LCGC14_1837240 [marine sediment metagenome]|uniref:Uncharacterized protein n=1 Tax=marine sediment metagenome TaxID=412755 RepID=A0A0F9ITP5_9ZZZZ